MSNTPNMGLVLPGVGTEAGPNWANDINADLSILDQHNHASGSGVPITPAGMSIISALSFQGNDAYLLRSARFQVQPALLSLAADLGCLYVVGVDLYYNDINGNQVRITESGGVAGTPGSISNLTSPASASYVAVSSTFVWQSDASTPANMDNASVILRNLSASSKGLTLSPPAAMAANYGLVLPSLPVATSIMTLDASGNMGSEETLPVSQLPVFNNQVSSTINDSILGTGAYADVANATVTITTTGRPVVMGFMSNSSTPGGIQLTGSGAQLSAITFNEGATVYSANSLGGSSGNYYPANGMQAFITGISPGAHTFKVQAKNVSGSLPALTFSNLVFYAYEI